MVENSVVLEKDNTIEQGAVYKATLEEKVMLPTELSCNASSIDQMRIDEVLHCTSLRKKVKKIVKKALR